MPIGNPNQLYDSPKALFQGVKDGQQKAKEQLYLLLRQECFPKIKAFIINAGGTAEDAEDFFQEAVHILFKGIEAGNFNFNVLSPYSHIGQMCAFLMGVAKNLWKKELRWRKRPAIEPDKQEQEQEIHFEILSGLIAEQFQTMEPQCKNLLTLFFRHNKSARMIAGELHQNTEDVKKNLTRCINQLLGNISQLLGPDHTSLLTDIVKKSMGELENRCRELLDLFYFQGRGMDDIAQTKSYANAHSAAEQKSRCMRHLNSIVVSHLIKL